MCDRLVRSNRSISAVVYIYARQILNDDSHITGNDGVMQVARRHVPATIRIFAREWTIMWDVLPGLSETQSFPSHLLHFLSNKFQDHTLLEMSRNSGKSTWNANL